MFSVGIKHVVLYFFPGASQMNLDKNCIFVPASTAQLDARLTGDQEVGISIPPGLATFFH